MKIIAWIIAFLLAGAPASSAKSGTSVGRIRTHDGYTLYFERVGDGPQVVLIPGRIFLAEALKPLASPRRTLVFYRHAQPRPVRPRQLGGRAGLGHLGDRNVPGRVLAGERRAPRALTKP